MKTLIQIVLVALVMGGLSAAGSIYWQQQFAAWSAPAAPATDPSAATAVEGESANKPTDADKSTTDSPGEPDAGDSPSKSEPASSKAAESELVAVQPYEPPVAARPPYVPEGDEAGHLINVLRSRVKSAADKEQWLVERQESLQLIFDDLRSEQEHTSKVRQRVLDELGESKRTNDEAQQSADDEQDRLRKQLETSREPTRQTNEASSANDTSGSPEENANLKKMATVYDSMPPENVVKVCQQLVKSGRTASVVTLLNAMKERQTAKVLATISETDQSLAADLTDRLKRLNSPVKKP